MVFAALPKTRRVSFQMTSTDQSKTLSDLLFVRGVLGVLIDQVDAAVGRVSVGNKPIGARELQSLKTAVTCAQSALEDLVKK